MIGWIDWHTQWLAINSSLPISIYYLHCMFYVRRLHWRACLRILSAYLASTPGSRLLNFLGQRLTEAPVHQATTRDVCIPRVSIAWWRQFGLTSDSEPWSSLHVVPWERLRAIVFSCISTPCARKKQGILHISWKQLTFCAKLIAL